jgi:hypothetical protein
MDRQIEVVKQRLAQLSRQERASYTSGGDTRFPINVIGSGAQSKQCVPR